MGEGNTYDLELDGLAIYFNGSDFLKQWVVQSLTYKVYADGWHEVVSEDIVL